MIDREKELVERVLSGDLASFEPLVEPYHRRLMGLAYRITRNSEDAKEVAQEAFLRAFKYLRNFDADKSFKSWLFQILVHAARNFRAKQARQESMVQSEPLREAAWDSAGSPERRHDVLQLRARLLDCLDELSPREREVFLLRDVEDLNIQETAQVLGASAISVRVHLSSARKKIRARIRDKHPDLLKENGS